MIDWESYADEAERATFDPDDRKIRIYTEFVPREMYDALRAAGFQRAPKQGCFFQVWTPEREDVALALCGEIKIIPWLPEDQYLETARARPDIVCAGCLEEANQEDRRRAEHERRVAEWSRKEPA